MTSQQQQQRGTPKITQTAVTSDHSKTYELHGEDHTIGNALRYVLMRDPRTAFCGYSIPHPSEAVVNLRLQTTTSETADKVLEEGLDTLKDVCRTVLEKFEEADEDFDLENEVAAEMES